MKFRMRIRLVVFMYSRGKISSSLLRTFRTLHAFCLWQPLFIIPEIHVWNRKFRPAWHWKTGRQIRDRKLKIQKIVILDETADIRNK